MNTKPGQMQSIDVGEVWHPKFYETSRYEVVECLYEMGQTYVILKFLGDDIDRTLRRSVSEMFKNWTKAEPAQPPIDVVVGLANEVKQARAELIRLGGVAAEATRAVTAQRVRVNELEDMFHVASQGLLK